LGANFIKFNTVLKIIIKFTIFYYFLGCAGKLTTFALNNFRKLAAMMDNLYQ